MTWLENEQDMTGHHQRDYGTKSRDTRRTMGGQYRNPGSRVGPRQVG